MTKRSGAQRKKNGRKQQTKNMYTNLPSIGDGESIHYHDSVSITRQIIAAEKGIVMLFTALAFADVSTNSLTDGEMNEHLNERFANVPVRHHQSPAGDNFPVEGPTRVNNDIREYFVLTNKPVTGGSWLEKPEIPASAEILPLNKATSKTNDDDSLVEVNEPLRPHKVQGAYEDKDEYLGTTYELLREDLIRPLREAVQVVRESPYKDEAEYDDNGLGVYDPVYIKSLVFSMRGLATRVAFSMSRVKKQVR